MKKNGLYKECPSLNLDEILNYLVSMQTNEFLPVIWINEFKTYYKVELK